MYINLILLDDFLTKETEDNARETAVLILILPDDFITYETIVASLGAHCLNPYSTGRLPNNLYNNNLYLPTFSTSSIMTF